MKRINNIYDNVTTLKAIMEVYNKQIKLNTKNKEKIEKFEHYLMLNLVKIQEMLINEKVTFDKYYIFLIYDPKYRIIMSQSIKDKIINHLVARHFLLNVFEKTLIDGNVATRINKGTLYGIKLVRKYINELKKENKPIYYLKCDIKKYFYNIDHDKLKQIIRTKIKDEKALLLIDKIIDTSNEEYVSKEIIDICKKEIARIENINLKENDKKKKFKEIAKIMNSQKSGKGIPIGNMTSQAFAIIYLNELDHFIKEKLNIKYYIRYMDDLIIIGNDKNQLKDALKEINLRLNKEYFLEFNEKTRIDMLKNGLDCLGFRFILENNKLYLKLRNKTKKKFKKKIKKMANLVKNNELDVMKYRQVIASYKGHLKWGNTYNFYFKTIKKNSVEIKVGCNIYINQEGDTIKG